MKFIKKLFNIPVKESKEVQKQEVDLALDDLFVHHFIEKGGKFLYCLKNKEVAENLTYILQENNWQNITVLDNDLSVFLESKVNTINGFQPETPVLISCEHLIADNGNILFSSNQLKSIKLSDMPLNFIVYATTSQLVKNTGEGLTGIKVNSKDKLPTNISAIKNYNLQQKEDSFLNYGNSNAKNLYLLLLEDL
jgi:L-lactate utilization protein LutC